MAWAPFQVQNLGPAADKFLAVTCPACKA